MTTLNPYIANQRAYIQEKKQQPLIGFTNKEGEQAKWEDNAFTFTYSSGTTANFLFNNDNQSHANINSTLTEEDRLDEELHHLLLSYCLDVLKENINIHNQRAKVFIAKKLLIQLNCNIASAPLSAIQHVIDNMGNTQYLPSFFDWLHKHTMLPVSSYPSFPMKRRSTRDKYGDDAIEAENHKLPNEKTLLALGAIFHDTIPPYKSIQPDLSAWEHLTSPSKKQIDAFVCTMSALAMSSPNRAAAEQTLLTKQRLKSHTEIVSGQKKTVYYLHWRGSKGYLDNQKHFNAEMAQSLDRALHYLSIVTEPARVLARFYKDPTRPLKNVLGDFEPNKKNLKLLDPAMDQPIMLFQLALLLGFYDATDKMIRVTPDTQGATKVPSNHRQQFKYVKSIIDLSPFDKFLFTNSCTYSLKLLGVQPTTKTSFNKHCAGKKTLTVAELQNHLVNVNQKNITGYNKKQTKKVDYENALFAFTNKQLMTNNASHFLLVPISSLDTFLSNNLKRIKGQAYKTIFERHGFSSDFFIRPHQFRHWQNDYLDKKGLPHLLTSILSGRKSAEQTLTYIHTTDAQNASVISDILDQKKTGEEAQANVSKRLKTKDLYDEATNNLSPTFVHETGFCVQNLTLSPCTYMTEFETQCTLCPSSCHIVQDSKAIELLEKDLKVQTYNLQKIQEHDNFLTSTSMQKWYKTHYGNTSMIKSLLSVLSDRSNPDGAIVRFLTLSNLIRITNLKTKTVIEQKLSLPDTENALQAAIEAKVNPTSDSAKSSFLGFLREIKGKANGD